MRSRKGIRTEENGKMHGTESSHSVGKSCHSKHRALAVHAIKKQQLIETGRDVFPDINLALYLDRFFFCYLSGGCLHIRFTKPYPSLLRTCQAVPDTAAKGSSKAVVIQDPAVATGPAWLSVLPRGRGWHLPTLPSQRDPLVAQGGRSGSRWKDNSKWLLVALPWAKNWQHRFSLQGKPEHLRFLSRNQWPVPGRGQDTVVQKSLSLAPCLNKNERKQDCSWKGIGFRCPRAVHRNKAPLSSLLPGARAGRWIAAEFNWFESSWMKEFRNPARFIALFIIYADSSCKTDLGTDYSK